MKRKVIGVLMALMLCLGIGVVAANGASASTETVGSCGAGYSQIDLYTIWDNDTVHIDGYLHLYYNGYRNCVMVEKNRWVGTASDVDAGVRVSGGTWSDDNHLYKYWAGPVYSAPSAGHCIDVTGLVEAPDYSTWGGVTISGVHCG